MDDGFDSQGNAVEIVVFELERKFFCYLKNSSTGNTTFHPVRSVLTNGVTPRIFRSHKDGSFFEIAIRSKISSDLEEVLASLNMSKNSIQAKKGSPPD